MSNVAYAMHSRFLPIINARADAALHKANQKPIDISMTESVAPMHILVPGVLTQDPSSKTVQVMDQRLFGEVCYEA